MRNFKLVDEYFTLKRLEEVNLMHLGFGEKLQALVDFTNSTRELSDYISPQNMQHHMKKLVAEGHVDFRFRRYIITKKGIARIEQLSLLMRERREVGIKKEQINLEKEKRKIDMALNY